MFDVFDIILSQGTSMWKLNSIQGIVVKYIKRISSKSLIMLLSILCKTFILKLILLIILIGNN